MGSQVKLGRHVAWSQISQWHHKCMMQYKDISFSLPHTFHTWAGEYVVWRCWEGLFDPERPGRSYSTCDRMIYCPLGTSKAPPALQFWNVHLWLQNSMWDHTPGPTSLPSLSVMFGVRLSLKWNINTSLPQLAPGRPHRLGAELAKVSEL